MAMLLRQSDSDELRGGSHGAFGLPSSLREDAYEPSGVSGLPPDVIGVSAGHFHSLAVTSEGQVCAGAAMQRRSSAVADLRQGIMERTDDSERIGSCKSSGLICFWSCFSCLRRRWLFVDMGQVQARATRFRE
ncbi:hypothetical protein MLD38_009580 [Melastoma candidum]|uniref:Uncharacterized protein n=1 Tax=Melastoma candidum TaxID=119954 RepID=A0ACB9RYK6_9MYRT|nr:hypothetical protein MLD38_009580 [Melastoma candidum]